MYILSHTGSTTVSLETYPLYLFNYKYQKSTGIKKKKKQQQQQQQPQQKPP